MFANDKFDGWKRRVRWLQTISSMVGNDDFDRPQTLDNFIQICLNNSMSSSIPEEVPEAARLMRAITRASDEMSRELSRLLQLNDLDLRAMSYLMENEKATVGELARHSGISMALASVVVDRIEAVGHCHRSRDEQDRRRVIIQPDPDSMQTAMSHLRPIIEATSDAYRDLDSTGQQAVTQFLNATLEAIRERSAQLQEIPAPTREKSPQSPRGE